MALLPTPTTLPTFVRCKATQRGLKVQNSHRQEPYTKPPLDVNVKVNAGRPTPIIAPVFVGLFAAQEAALKAEVVEQVVEAAKHFSSASGGQEA